MLGQATRFFFFFFFQQPHFLSLALYRSISHCFCGLSPFSRRFFVQLGDLCKLAAPETSEPFIPRLRLSSVDARQPAWSAILARRDVRDILNFKPCIIIIRRCPHNT